MAASSFLIRGGMAVNPEWSPEPFAADILDREELKAVLLEQADKVATRLRKRALSGRTICLKLRYDDFSTITRRVSVGEPTCLAETIYAEAKTLLEERTDAGKRPVRLIGVGVSGFAKRGDGQGSLFGSEARDREKLERLERMTDSIRAKLGADAIGRASIKLREQE